MKSIKQQYIDLCEGKMSQHNFMRTLRMTLPQYVTNVTSFSDSIRILKNKGILSESNPNYTNDPLNTVPVDTSLKSKDNLVDIILKYVKDPDDAEKYASSNSETWPEWLEVELNRDPEYTKYTSGKEGYGEMSEASTLDRPSQSGRSLVDMIELLYDGEFDDDPKELTNLLHLVKNSTDPDKQEILGVINNKLKGKDNNFDASLNEAKETKGSSGKEQYSQFSEAENDNLQELTTGINI